MKKVLILSGLPGSGKTYYAETLQQQWGHQCRVVSTDYYWGHDYRFDPSKLAEAHEWCFRQFMEQVEKETPLIVVDNTNLRTMEISPYHLAGSAFGYEVEVQRILCDVNEAFDRKKHPIPFKTFMRMVEAWENFQAPPWWKVVEL